MNCKECNKPMKLRKGSYGEFYGCTGYPQCKNTEQIAPTSPKNEVVKSFPQENREYPAGQDKRVDPNLIIVEKLDLIIKILSKNYPEIPQGFEDE